MQRLAAPLGHVNNEPRQGCARRAPAFVFAAFEEAGERLWNAYVVARVTPRRLFVDSVGEYVGGDHDASAPVGPSPDEPHAPAYALDRARLELDGFVYSRAARRTFYLAPERRAQRAA